MIRLYHFPRSVSVFTGKGYINRPILKSDTILRRECAARLAGVPFEDTTYLPNTHHVQVKY